MKYRVAGVLVAIAALVAAPAMADPIPGEPGLKWYTDREGEDFANCQPVGVRYTVKPHEPIETPDGTRFSLTETFSANGDRESVTFTAQLGTRTVMGAFIISSIAPDDDRGLTTVQQPVIERRDAGGRYERTFRVGTRDTYPVAIVCTGAAT